MKQGPRHMLKIRVKTGENINEIIENLITQYWDAPLHEERSADDAERYIYTELKHSYGLDRTQANYAMDNYTPTGR